MKTFDITLVQGDKPCEYTCGKEEYLDLITEYCGCKPSKWDGCKAAEVAPQLWQGMMRLLQAIDRNKELQDADSNAVAASIFLNQAFKLCKRYPEARVEVRF